MHLCRTSFTPSWKMEAGLHKFLSLIILLIALVSCSDGSSMLLSSEDGAEIWIEASDAVIVITSDADMQNRLSELSGSSPDKALSELFAIDDVTLVDSASYREREELLALLSDGAGRRSGFDARVHYDDALDGSEFLARISELSSSFDERLSEKIIRKHDICREYRMKNIFPSFSTWDEARVFAERWKESILERN